MISPPPSPPHRHPLSQCSLSTATSVSSQLARPPMEQVCHLLTAVTRHPHCVLYGDVSPVNIAAPDNTLGFRVGTYRRELLVVGNMPGTYSPGAHVHTTPHSPLNPHSSPKPCTITRVANRRAGREEIYAFLYPQIGIPH